VEELGVFASRMPHKVIFAIIFLAWLALFHFLGNSVLGYVRTPSIFGWLQFYTQTTDDTLGIFVPIAVVTLFWWKRDELLATHKEVWWPALAFFVAAVFLHVLGYTVQQTRLSIVSFFVGLYAVTGLLWGVQWLRATFFPFFLFAFLMPPTSEMEGITLPLRHLATKLTVMISNGLLGICVNQEGTIMRDCAGHFQYNVEAACSGLRSLTTMLALGCAFAFITFQSNWKRALMISSAVPLAILGNVIRLLSIVIGANWKYDQMIHAREPIAVAEQAAQAFGGFIHEHDLLKLAPYVPAFIGMMLLARWLPEDRREERKQPEVAMPRQSARSIAIVVLALIAGVTAFLSTQQSRQKLGEPGVRVVQEPIYALAPGASTNPPVLVSNKSVYLPAQVLDYRSQRTPISQVTVDALPKDTLFGYRSYVQSNGFGLACHVVLMGADRTSIHKPQYCLQGSGYATVSSEPVTVRISRPHPYDLPIMKLNLRQMNNQGSDARTRAAVFAYWFVADDKLTSSHVDRMWWTARDMLRTGVLQRWAYVICFAPCEPGQEEQTFEKMKEFIAASVPEFQLAVGPPAADIAAAKQAPLVLR